MQFEQPLQEAVLLRRYKRFLADVELADGTHRTLHCPNTGSMLNCQEPGSRVWYTLSDNPARKYPGTWQIVEVDGRYRVGINTSLANRLVAEAVTDGRIPQLSGYATLRREVPYGEGQGSRIDLLLEDSEKVPCYVEIKNVSLGAPEGDGLFPDAVTLRGQKHLRELMAEVARGNRALLFFCVQHTGVERVRPAEKIDPQYAELLREAAAAGVELLAYRAEFELPEGRIELRRPLPIVL